MPAIFCVYGKVKIRYNVSMENLRTLLKEQMNIDFMSAVLSGPRTKDGTAKVKVRPLMKKDTLFFQLEIFRGNQAFHKNLEPEAAAEEVLGSCRRCVRCRWTPEQRLTPYLSARKEK